MLFAGKLEILENGINGWGEKITSRLGEKRYRDTSLLSNKEPAGRWTWLLEEKLFNYKSYSQFWLLHYIWHATYLLWLCFMSLGHIRLLPNRIKSKIFIQWLHWINIKVTMGDEQICILIAILVSVQHICWPCHDNHNHYHQLHYVYEIFKLIKLLG